MAFAAADEVPVGRFFGVGLLGIDCCKRVFADASRILESMASRRWNVACSFARNPVGVLATVCGLDRVIVVLGSLFANVYSDGQIAKSRLVHPFAIRGGDRLGWLRTDSSILCNRVCSMHACT